MTEEYNQHFSEQRHYERMHRLQEIRDSLTEIINHFYDYPPKSGNEEREYVRDMRYRLDGIWRELESFYKDL
jgi:hypothetical protein